MLKDLISQRESIAARWLSLLRSLSGAAMVLCASSATYAQDSAQVGCRTSMHCSPRRSYRANMPGHPAGLRYVHSARGDIGRGLATRKRPPEYGRHDKVTIRNSSKSSLAVTGPMTSQNVVASHRRTRPRRMWARALLGRSCSISERWTGRGSPRHASALYGNGALRHHHLTQ